MKRARKHERFIEDLKDVIRVTPGFGFYLRPSHCSLGPCKAQRLGLLGIKRTRARETRQGRLRPFFRGFYGAHAVGASASHEISHMRRRYSALSMGTPTHKKTEMSYAII